MTLCSSFFTTCDIPSINKFSILSVGCVMKNEMPVPMKAGRNIAEPMLFSLINML